MGNIYLTGFMGTGKTSVGLLLAERLGLRYQDLDQYIEAEARLSVAEIFACFGEPHFRGLETAALQSLAEEQKVVVSTGGGTVIAPHNRRVMHRSGVIVNLTATIATLLQRLNGDVTRPLLQGDDPLARITELLAEREVYYADADLRVATDGRTVDDIAGEVCDWLAGKDAEGGNDYGRA